MNKILTVVLLLLAIFAVSCVTLAAPEVRMTRNVHNTNKVTQKAAYKRAEIWFAKAFVDSNHVIKLKDESSGRIVGAGKVECNKISRGATLIGGNIAWIDFNLDFQAKDNRVRVNFDGIHHYIQQQNGLKTTHGPTNKSDVDEIYNNCLKPLEIELINTVSGKDIKAADDNF